MDLKRVYITVPEGGGTKDIKAELATLDVICNNIREDKELEKV